MNRTYRDLMVKHPEFARNLLLGFKPFSILSIGLPILAFMGIFSNSFKADSDFYFYYSAIISLLFTALGGSLLSSASLNDEFAFNTWDMQRINPTGPWAMLAGKLFGSTLIVWALSLPLTCLGLVFGSGKGIGYDTFIFVYIILISFGMQSLSLLLVLAVNKNQFKANSNAGPAFLASSLIYLPIGLTLLSIALSDKHIPWYWLDIPPKAFALYSAALLAAWLLYGTYRLMRTELQLSNGPWAWSAFHICVLVYFGGIFHARTTDAKVYDNFLIYTLTTSIMLTYASFFQRSDGVVHMRRLFRTIASKNNNASCHEMPLWFSSLGITIALAFVEILFANQLRLNIIEILTLVIRDAFFLATITLCVSQARRLGTIILSGIILYIVFPLALGRGILMFGWWGGQTTPFTAIAHVFMAAGAFYMYWWVLSRKVLKGLRAQAQSPSV